MAGPAGPVRVAGPVGLARGVGVAAGPGRMATAAGGPAPRARIPARIFPWISAPRAAAAAPRQDRRSASAEGLARGRGPPPPRKGWAGPLAGLLALGLVAVVAVVAVLIVVQRAGPEPAPGGGGLTEAERAAGCTPVQQHPLAGVQHIAPDQQPSDWNSNPPT